MVFKALTKIIPFEQEVNLKIPSPITHRRAMAAANRLTALWALSESALAGVLHAFRIPLTGLFMASVTVLVLTLIHRFNPAKGALIKATFLVLILKAVVSPQTPFNAYLAVGFQGLAAEFLFIYLKNEKSAALLLGILALLQSAVQKLLVLTIVFGKALWQSIDVFGRLVLKVLGLNGPETALPGLSLLLIAAYAALHLAFGIFCGWYAPGLSEKVWQNSVNGNPIFIKNTTAEKTERQPSKRRRRFRKISLYFILALAGSLFIFSYIFPVLDKHSGYAAVLMIVRSVIILLIWYYGLAPLLKKYLHRYLREKENRYSAEIQDMLKLLPLLRPLIKQSWRQHAEFPFPKRLNFFTESFLAKLLNLQLNKEADAHEEQPSVWKKEKAAN